MKTLVVERDGRITVHEVNKPRYNEYQALVKTPSVRCSPTSAISVSSPRTPW